MRWSTDSIRRCLNSKLIEIILSSFVADADWNKIDIIIILAVVRWDSVNPIQLIVWCKTIAVTKIAFALRMKQPNNGTTDAVEMMHRMRIAYKSLATIDDDNALVGATFVVRFGCARSHCYYWMQTLSLPNRNKINTNSPRNVKHEFWMSCRRIR